MAYIGNSPANVGNYQIVDNIASGFNGSATSFAIASGGIAITPAKTGQVLCSINGVLQQPDDAGSHGFRISSSNIIFSSAPASGDVFWAVYQGQAVDIGLPSNNSVTTTHLVNDAVTADKLANSINAAITANTAKTGISSAQANAITANTNAIGAGGSGITSAQANAITANTSKNTNATHSGDVTGSGALTIAADAVTYAKMQNVSATNRILGRDSSGAGIVEEITPANLRTMINVADGATVGTTSASDLTSGTLPDARFPSTLPSISGANLTNLVSSFAGLTDTTVATSNPAANTNPPAVGHLYLNKVAGLLSVCTNATSNNNVWKNVGDVPAFVAASGGTVTTSGDYKIHTFTSSGTFTVSNQGNDLGANTIAYLVIAGGGGAGGAVRGGGAGAGGYRSNWNSETSGGGANAEAAMACPSGSNAVTVGAGGACGSYSADNAAAAGASGANSVFNGITSLGGGNGGGSDGPKNGTSSSGRVPSSGGSGGGGFYGASDLSPFAGTSGQGYAGGQSGSSAPYGAGGGGAGGVGKNYNSNTNPCDGGEGRASTISGSSVIRAGGGGSSTYPGQSGPVAGSANTTGGPGGGGLGYNAMGRSSGSSSSNGVANKGAGGGASGNGGSGIVIIRYKYQ